MAQKVEVEDFSGGITDYYLSAPPNKVKQCDNLLINQYQDQGKVFTRQGSRLYDKTAARVPTASQINTSFYYNNKLFIQQAAKLYYYKTQTVNAGSFVVDEIYEISELGDTNFVALGASKNEVGVAFKANAAGSGTGKVRKGSWQAIPGQSGHDAFPAATGDHQFTYANWNYHTFIANSSGSGNVMKVTTNEAGPVLVQAGLPKLNSAGIQKTYPSAPSDGKNYLYRIVYRRRYSAGATSSTQFLDISTPSDVIEVINFSVPSYPTLGIGALKGPLVGAADKSSFPLVGDPDFTYWENNTDKYYYWNPSISDYQEVTYGSPAFNAKIRHNVQLTSIPVLTNTSDTNWDVTNTKRDVYRTVNNGTTYYYVGTVGGDGGDNTTTTFTDSLNDTISPIKSYQTKALFPATGDETYLYYSISTNKYYKWVSVIGFYILWDDLSLEVAEQLYTNGGVVGNDAPPKCKSLHVRNDIGYYGNVNNQYYRLLQSIPGDIDSVPETFYVDVDDEIVAVSSTKNNVIILCKNKVYRVDGFFDELGRGGMTVERISDTAGCIGVNTPVQALDGVLWLGKDAVFFTDGFKVVKLNQDYDKTYKTFTETDENNNKFQGKYDSRKNRVWWTICDESNTPNKCYVLDLNWGIRENATFTTVSGNSFVPCAIEFINGDMVRCDQYGFVLIHKDNLYVDPKIEPSVSVLDWINETIIYTLETASYNFGSSAVRKYVTQANVTCESTTNLALQIVSNNDDNRIVADLLPIRYRGNILWREPDVYWGDISLDWNKQGLIHEKRLMPAKSLRCNFKSIKFTNAKVAIVSSDTIGTSTINSVTKTVTLTNTTDYDWPDKAVGYFIAFESDNYTNEYEILARTDDSLTYQDTLNLSVSGTNQKWVIRGKPQGETLNLLNFSIVYDIAGQSLNPYKTSNSGEVGA